MTKTAIYARQSIDKKDSLSIEGQIELCKKECYKDDIEIYSDKGFSGKNTKRPDFERLMQDISEGKISRLVCYRLDRVSRNIVDFGKIWETLNENKVDFVSVNERFDTSSTIGRAMIYIIMIFAQMERETIAERVKDNYYQRAKKGAWAGGPAPYGFDIIKKNGICRLNVNENIDIVKFIFDEYVKQGASLRSVAMQLNKKGITCAQRKQWDSVSVGRLLRTPAYVKANVDVRNYYAARGVIVNNPVEDYTGEKACFIFGKRLANERKYTDLSEHLLVIAAHNGIIPPDMFIKCQYKFDNNKQIKNAGKGKYTWLSGLLKCGQCGYSLKVLNDARTGKQYLVCSGRTNLKICDCRHSENIRDVEAFVKQQLSDKIAETVSQRAQRKECKENNINELKISLAKVEEKISNLIKNMSEANDVAMKYINIELAKLDGERTELTEKIANIMTAQDIDKLKYVNVSELDFDGLKSVAGEFIRKIRCINNEVLIDWKS